MPQTEKDIQNSSWSEGSSGENAKGKPPFSKRLKRNCAKWWWLYFLLLIIVVVVVVIPIIFVAIPKIAQQTLNKATIMVINQSTTDPGPNSISLVINSTVDSHSSKEATVQGFNASFYLLDTEPNIKPFIYAEFPSVSTSQTEANLAQSDIPIADMDQFIAYNTLVLNSEEFSIGVRGHTHVVLSGLPKYGVTYDKTVTMKGYNKFKGLTIQDVQFHVPPLYDGATMTGTVTIPNPSVISSQFGNVTLQVSANGTYLGYSVLEYVWLKPGNNTIDMRSYLNTTAAVEYLHDNVLDLQLVGNSSVNIGGQHLIYFEEALKTNVIDYRLNLTEAAAPSSS